MDREKIIIIVFCLLVPIVMGGYEGYLLITGKAPKPEEDTWFCFFLWLCFLVLLLGALAVESHRNKKGSHKEQAPTK